LNSDKAENIKINTSKKNLEEKVLIDQTLLKELKEFDKIPSNIDHILI
jgi:hypothetical protein